VLSLSAEKPRRGVRLGLDAPAIVNHHRSDVRIILYGSNERGKSWLDLQHLGLLGVWECGEHLQPMCGRSDSNPIR
jgi:hypothetical protein